jgi:hypothetical protein
MDEYEDIETAARHQDWQECARIMFIKLFRCSKEQQRNVASGIINTYAPVWHEKHEGPLGCFPVCLLLIGAWAKRLMFPDLPEDLNLDPADAEFENGLFEFCNGVSTPFHRRYTANFATAIRSSVTARHINKWLVTHSDEYVKWKAGLGFEGPTFLDDDAAASEAFAAWIFVDRLLQEQRPPSASPSEQLRASREVARLYHNWEETIM